MKTLALPLFAALLCLSARGEEPATFDRLETLAGKVYEKAKVTRVELDVAILQHSGGVARIAAADLAEEVRAKIPFDLEGAAKARAAQQAAALAAEREAELDRLYPAYDVEVKQIVPGGVLCFLATAPSLVDHAWFNRRDLQFVELDAEGLGLVDDQRVEGVRLERLEKPYAFETVLGARATVPRWRHYDKAGFAPRKPLTPGQRRARGLDRAKGPGGFSFDGGGQTGGGQSGGQADVNYFFGR